MSMFKRKKTYSKRESWTCLLLAHLLRSVHGQSSIRQGQRQGAWPFPSQLPPESTPLTLCQTNKPKGQGLLGLPFENSML